MKTALSKPCPFCGKMKLKFDYKCKFHAKRINGIPMSLYSGSIRCNCCHARGPVISEYFPSEHPKMELEKFYEEFEEKVINKWEERM